MRFRDLLYETWQSLMANKARNLLTILGVVIGISAVIAMTAMIAGVKQSLYSEMGMDQTRMITINVSTSNGRALSFSQLDSMERNLPGYEFVTGVIPGYVEVLGLKGKTDANLMGVEPEYFQARAITPSQGAVFTESQARERAKVAVIDETLAREVFGANENPIGRSIHLGDLGDCQVVGVVSAGASSVGTAYVPAYTAEPLFGVGNGQLSLAIGYAREGVDPSALASQTKDYLQNLYNVPDDEVEDSIYITTMKDLMEQVDSFMGAFQVMMTAVAGVSLLVGGIGIMNMMLTNVTERIREIGLRKALGARRSSIIAQFLFESIALTLVGGLIGTVLGYGGAWLLAGIAGAVFMGEGTSVMPVISVEIAVATVLICVAIGVIFGFYPAQRAARLDPVESLRHQ